MTPSPASAANSRITALAADRTIHRAFHWLHLYEQQLQRWHREFLAIPAPPFGEANRADWFAARFTDLAITNPHVDHEGNALAGLTALLAIAAALRYAQTQAHFTPPATILFAANVGEEGEGNLRGMRHLFTAAPYAHHIRAAIALEGCGTGTVVD